MKLWAKIALGVGAGMVALRNKQEADNRRDRVEKGFAAQENNKQSQFATCMRLFDRCRTDPSQNLMSCDADLQRCADKSFRTS